VTTESSHAVSTEGFEYSNLRIGGSNGKDDTVGMEGDGSVGSTGGGIFGKGTGEDGRRFTGGRSEIVDGPSSIGLSGTDEGVTGVKGDLVDFGSERDVASDTVDRLSTRRSPNAN